MKIHPRIPMSVKVGKLIIDINNDEVVVTDVGTNEFVAINAHNGHVALGKEPEQKPAPSSTPALNVMRVMQENEWLNVRDLARITGHNAVEVTEVLHSLMDAGEVERRGVFYRWIGD